MSKLASDSKDSPPAPEVTATAAASAEIEYELVCSSLCERPLACEGCELIAAAGPDVTPTVPHWQPSARAVLMFWRPLVLHHRVAPWANCISFHKLFATPHTGTAGASGSSSAVAASCDSMPEAARRAVSATVAAGASDERPTFNPLQWTLTHASTTDSKN